MKKIIYAFSFIVIIVLAQSCNKFPGDRHDAVSKQIVIDTALFSNTQYQIDLTPYGDADDVASITKQATNFITSEIVNTPGVFAPVYHYVSSGTAKTSVTDQVVLLVKEGDHNGNYSNNNNHPHHMDSTTITINFLIK